MGEPIPKRPTQFYQSPDATPLCSTCAWSAIAWPARFDDVAAHDRCGAGWQTMNRSTRKCFDYDGEHAELVTVETKIVPVTDWQDRTDGMTVRKPK